MRVRHFLFLVVLFYPAYAQADGYVVRPGDTLSTIALRFHTSLYALARTNGIGNLDVIRAGEYLTLPAGAGLSPGSRFYYRVRWGDTLIGVSRRFGVPIATIRALNRLGPYLIAGSLLRLCSPCGFTASQAGAPPQAAAADSAPSGATYIVRRGDSLSDIAARLGTTQAALIAANGITDPNHILIGSRLAVPAGAPVPVLAAGYDPWSARLLIGSWARTYGIEPSLALAVAWQESGFNQNRVSPTGAIGVMQVEPYTGRRISQWLGRAMSLYDTQDNIQSGVFWLAHLVAYYGGNERLAAAAYYEGTQSLARYGLFGDTVQYVNSVMALKARFGG